MKFILSVRKTLFNHHSLLTYDVSEIERLYMVYRLQLCQSCDSFQQRPLIYTELIKAKREFQCTVKKSIFAMKIYQYG